MSELIMLIGLPGSGKTTYRNKMKNSDKNYLVFSTDDMIEEEARKLGKTYSEVFPTLNHGDLAKRMKNGFKEAVKLGRNIIIDRTNMSAKRRKEFLALPPEYEKIAVVFSIPDKLLRERLDKREKEEGKAIPPMVISQMARNYVAPTKAEFDKIIEIRD